MAVGIMTLLSIQMTPQYIPFEWIKFTQICAANLEIIKEYHQPAWIFPNGQTIFLNWLYGQLVAHSFRPNKWPPVFWGVISSQILWWFYIFYFPCYEKSAKNAVTLVESCFSWIDDHLSLQFTNPENQQDLLALVGLCGKQTSTEKPKRAKRKL